MLQGGVAACPDAALPAHIHFKVVTTLSQVCYNLVYNFVNNGHTRSAGFGIIFTHMKEKAIIAPS